MHSPMHPSKNMRRVVGGQRYNVGTATLLASDVYWDGSNYDRGGRNTFLYRTRGGAFFEVGLTMWQGERDTLEPLSQEDAQRLYEKLPEHEVEYEQAFDAEVEEASAGRPTYYGNPMRQTAIWMPDEQIAWLKAQESGMSETIRKLIEQAMAN